MLIGIDSSPCIFSLRNRSTLCSTTKCHQNKSDLKNLFFFNFFYSFNPNHAYWNQWRLFSGNLPGMFEYLAIPNFRMPHFFSAQNNGYFIFAPHHSLVGIQLLQLSSARAIFYILTCNIKILPIIPPPPRNYSPHGSILFRPPVFFMTPSYKL